MSLSLSCSGGVLPKGLCSSSSKESTSKAVLGKSLGNFRGRSAGKFWEVQGVFRSSGEVPLCNSPNLSLIHEDLEAIMELSSLVNDKLYFSDEYWTLERKIGKHMRACLPGPIEDAGLLLQHAMLRLFLFALTGKSL